MKTTHFLLATFALSTLGAAVAGAVVHASSVAAGPVSTSAVLRVHAQAAQEKPAAPADAPMSRDQILKEGATALQQNCNRCHLSDKWEGTNRDHEGWAAIVNEMSRQMSEAQMPPMSDKTTNLIVDYLTLTRPQ